MKTAPIILLAFILLISFGCGGEACTIDFEGNQKEYAQIVREIYGMGIEMPNANSFYSPVFVAREKDSVFSVNVFGEIEFIECHEDSTLIFQAPNCTKGSALRDVVNFLAYAPGGPENVMKKRNVGSLKHLEKNWFMGTHIYTLAN